MKSSILLPVILLSFFSATAQEQPVTVKEYKKVFTTYPFSDPDPIPKPDTKIYPYYRFDGFTDKPVQKEWKVVEIENEYIKIMILPEVGGKVWSAVEKSTGKDFIYNNHVVKFRDIAMRGPWTSGGIEANYSIIGHTPNCATPVDYTIVKRDDGSVSCVIGVLDLITRTSWRLDINLPKDKAYLTTSSYWFNATAFEQPYYTWMNTGIKAKGNLQFIYPGNKYLGHNGEYSDWPINKKNGKDISFYENNSFGGYKSYHVFGKYTDFFGGYWHDDDFGMARYSTHDDKAGKKIWIWGLSQQGMIWEKLLTDTDGQYTEVQSGRLFNQSSEGSALTPFKHRSFAPYQADTWKEYWFPVKHTKGFVKANQYGAVNVKQEDGWLKIYFSPLQALQEKLEIFDGGKSIYAKNISVKPMELFADSLKITADKNNLKLTIGENKLVWSSAPDDGDLARPVEIPKDFDNNSLYGLYLQGKNDISFKDYIKAEEKLHACLQKDPNFVPALNELSYLQLRRLDFSGAVKTASKALAVNTYEPAANFYYALANLQLGDSTDAKDGFDIASSSVAFRSAAFTELSKIYFKENDHSLAADYAQKALLSNQHNGDALQLLAMIFRLQKNNAEATKMLNRIQAIDPLNHFADFEKYLLSGTAQSKEQFASRIQNEMPQQTYLELGISYQQLNRKEEALKVFSLSPLNPEILYWTAYLENKPVDMSKMKMNYTFPFRFETAAVIQSLIKSNDNWQLKYHLALIEWSRNNVAKAKTLFTQCGEQPDDAAFYAARASLNKTDKQEAEKDLVKAIALDKKEWRFPKLLAEHYIVFKEYEKALNTVEPFYRTNKEYYVMGMLYAKALLLNKKYKETGVLLTGLQILPFEGATAGRQLYHEAKLMQAIAAYKNKQYKKVLPLVSAAKLWPQNLGVGKPYDAEIDERLENWLDYKTYSAMGKPDEATKSLQKITAFTPKVDNTVSNFLPANHLVTAWAMEKTASKQHAAAWLKAQAGLYPDNKIIQWALQVFNNQAPVELRPDEKDGELRILEQLL
jgi:Flp pilus assembly protein TadD